MSRFQAELLAAVGVGLILAAGISTCAYFAAGGVP